MKNIGLMLLEAGFTVTATLIFTELVSYRFLRRSVFSRLAYWVIADICAFVILAGGVCVENGPVIFFSAAAIALYSYCAWMEWKKRRKDRKKLALGSKTKAIIAKMRRKIAERPTRPVLRPVPQGTR